MEDSAYNSLMMGVYIVIFVMATSITIYLFSSTIEFAEKAYEYGKLSTGDSIVEVPVNTIYNTVTGAELLTYYYNYKSPDKYGTTVIPGYNFSNLEDIYNAGIVLDSTYTLKYSSVVTGLRPVIIVTGP